MKKSMKTYIQPSISIIDLRPCAMLMVSNSDYIQTNENTNDVESVGIDNNNDFNEELFDIL